MSFPTLDSCFYVSTCVSFVQNSRIGFQHVQNTEKVCLLPFLRSHGTFLWFSCSYHVSAASLTSLTVLKESTGFLLLLEYCGHISASRMFWSLFFLVLYISDFLIQLQGLIPHDVLSEKIWSVFDPETTLYCISFCLLLWSLIALLATKHALSSMDFTVDLLWCQVNALSGS